MDKYIYIYILKIRFCAEVGGRKYYLLKNTLSKAISLQPARVCSNTASLEGHCIAPLSRLLKHNLSRRPFRCSLLLFAQLQPLWKAISLHPCRVCSKTQKHNNTQTQNHKKHKNFFKLSFVRLTGTVRCHMRI